MQFDNTVGIRIVVRFDIDGRRDIGILFAFCTARETLLLRAANVNALNCTIKTKKQYLPGTFARKRKEKKSRVNSAAVRSLITAANNVYTFVRI